MHIILSMMCFFCVDFLVCSEDHSIYCKLCTIFCICTFPTWRCVCVQGSPGSSAVLFTCLFGDFQDVPKYKNQCLELQPSLILTPVQAFTIVTGLNNNQRPPLPSPSPRSRVKTWDSRRKADDMGLPRLGKEPAFRKTRTKSPTLTL